MDECLVVSWYMSADMQLTVIGLALLYVMTKHQMLGWIAILSTFTIGVKLSTAQKTVGLAVMFVASEAYQHVAFVLEYEFGRAYNGLQHALYAATYRVVFALPWASMLCVYFTTGFEGLFENSFMAVIGRLTYSVFLVNTVIQFLHAASQRSVMANSILMNRFWWVVTDVLFSYFFGAGLFFFFEAPIANLSKLIKRSFLRKSETDSIPPVSNERSPSPGTPKKGQCFLD